MNNTSQEFAIGIKREVMDRLNQFQKKIEEIERMRARMKRMQDGIMDSIKSVDDKYGDYQVENIKSIGEIEHTLKHIRSY